MLVPCDRRLDQRESTSRPIQRGRFQRMAAGIFPEPSDRPDFPPREAKYREESPWASYPSPEGDPITDDEGQPLGKVTIEIMDAFGHIEDGQIVLAAGDIEITRREAARR
jgi:hypothetical protein